ncbi:hypothetical protein GCM10010234_72240 [Streptomyces hawaiiensis]
MGAAVAHTGGASLAAPVEPEAVAPRGGALLTTHPDACDAAPELLGCAAHAGGGRRGPAWSAPIARQLATSRLCCPRHITAVARLRGHPEPGPEGRRGRRCLCCHPHQRPGCQAAVRLLSL